MGQWGYAKEIDGIHYLSHLKTESFEASDENSIIDDIMLLGRDIPQEEAEQKLALMKRAFVGKKHIEWINFEKEKNIIMDELKKTHLIYRLVFDTDAVVFEAKVNGLLQDDWDLAGGTFVKNVTNKEECGNIHTTTLFQPMTKVIQEETERP